MSLKNATKTETANRVKLEVEVDAAAFEAAVERAYKKNIKKMVVPGFRKGKAPRHLVEKMYGTGVFYEDAMNDVYPKALDEAIKESDYEYVQDKIDLDVVSVGPEGLVFKAVITVKPEVEVGEYKGLKADKKVEPVTDEDVDAEITKLQERNARLVPVEGRAAENGDTVTFDFEGFLDGEPFEGGKSENHTLVLGSGQFIPGFEDQIVGKNTDEEFEVNVTFPEDYHAEELKGKPAVFKCKLHEIKTKELPEVNDEFVKDVSEFDTLDELKADLRKHMEEHRQQEADNAFETALLDQLAEGVKADIPQAMFENRIDDMVQDFGYRLQSQGLDLPTYLQYTGMEPQAFRDGFKDQADKQVKVRLALEKIAALESIEVTEDDMNAEYEKYAKMYDMDVDKVKAVLGEQDMKRDLAVGKALELVKENAVVTE